jgi:hypothetical protein
LSRSHGMKRSMSVNLSKPTIEILVMLFLFQVGVPISAQLRQACEIASRLSTENTRL